LLPPEKRELEKKEFRFDKLRILQFGNSEYGMIYKYNSHLLEAASWNVPSLTTAAIDLDARTSIEEVMGFLQAHGSKLRSLSLTDSGRVEGIPITWQDVFTLCPNVTELRTTYKPFMNFNIGAYAAETNIEADHGDATDEVDAAGEVTPNPPGLPHLITSTVAGRLERFCFDQWEFFPGLDCVLGHGDDHGPDANPILADPEQFLASILAHSPEAPLPISPTIPDSDGEPNPTSKEGSDRVLKAYCRILDNVFRGLGGKMTPTLQVIQFDFQAGRLDLPDACIEWWQRWLLKWRSMGLRVEGCERIPL